MTIRGKDDRRVSEYHLSGSRHRTAGLQALVGAGVVVSYLTLRPRAGAVPHASEITAAGELEAIGESLGELVARDAP